MARRNIAAASVSKNIELKVSDFMELTPPPSPLCIITNPPYGERIKADVEKLYSNMGSTLKHKYTDTTCHIISSSREGFNSLGLKPSSSLKLFNGEIECEFKSYRIFGGKFRDFKKSQNFNRTSKEAKKPLKPRR